MTITAIVLTSESRGNQMWMQIEATTLDDNRDLRHERLAKLLGRVVGIKVGATTEADLQEKKARLENALNATRGCERRRGAGVDWRTSGLGPLTRDVFST